MAHLCCSTFLASNTSPAPTRDFQVETKVPVNSMKGLEELKKIEEEKKQLWLLNSPDYVAISRKEVVENKAKLKSDLKRSTAFVKKLKLISESTFPMIRKDIDELNLTRYISECVSAIAEANLKASDLPSAVQVCSKLHQRYFDFSENLIQSLASIFDIPFSSSDDRSAVLKRRMTLRLLCDLFVAGVYSDSSVIVKIIQQLVQPYKKVEKKSCNPSRQSSLNVPVLVSFAKHASESFLGIISSRKQQLIQSSMSNEQNSYDSSSSCSEVVVNSSIQQQLVALMDKAYEDICVMLLAEQENLRKKEKRNEREILNKGEISEEHSTDLEQTKKHFEKLFMNVNALGEALNKELPVLPEDKKISQEDGTICVWEGGEGRVEMHIDCPFDDEDTRSFYEDLPYLLDIVPPVVLGLSESEVANLKQQRKQQSEEEQQLDEGDVEDSENVDLVEEDSNDEEEQETIGEITSDVGDSSFEKKTSHHFDLFLEELEHIVNRDRCDKAAVDFCYHNSKSTRKRLVKALYGLPRTHLELIPYYSRFVAILNPVLKDIRSSLLELLVDEFRYLQKKKNQHRLESKIRNIRFLAELTKFKICPPIIGFSCLKRCFNDFQGHNIDIATTFLETCGRFLYRQKHTHQRLNNYLEIMMRLMKAKNLDNRYETLVQNAFYICKPLENTKEKKKDYSPLYLYIRRLLHQDLNKTSVEGIIRTLRKLPWQDLSTMEYVIKASLKVTKGRFMHLHLVSDVIAGLSRTYDFLGIKIVDAVIENIRIGLGSNDLRDQQRRIGFIKFFGELYNYNLVNTMCMFQVLYLLVNYGHDYLDYLQQISATSLSSPSPIEEEILRKVSLVEDFRYDPRVPCSMDTVHDFFRIRLICHLLDLSGQYFSKGPSRVKFDRFFLFFQRYILSKHSLPTEIEFLILDLFESLKALKNIRRFTTWEEADEAVQSLLTKELENEQPEINKMTLINSERISTKDIIIDDEDEEEEDGDHREDEEEIEDEELEEEKEEQDVSSLSDEDIVLLDRPLKSEEDEEFEKEFRALMQESLESRKHIVRVNVDNMAIPPSLKASTGVDESRKNHSSSSNTVIDFNNKNKSNTTNGKGVLFNLLKRGNKGKVEARQFVVPESTSLAHHSQRQEDAAHAEHSQLKRFVLEYGEREDYEDKFDVSDIEFVFNAPLGRNPGWNRHQVGRSRGQQRGNGNGNGSGGGGGNGGGNGNGNNGNGSH